MVRKGFLLSVTAVIFALAAASAVAALAQKTQSNIMPQLTLGEPGTVFRYDHTYGEPAVPYLADSSNLLRVSNLSISKNCSIFS